MKAVPEILRITEAQRVSQCSLKLRFSDGVEREIDFKPFLERSSHPDIKKYLKPKYFKTFTLADGDLMWGDFDLVFPIMDLYTNKLSSHANSCQKT